jgi:S1-C subfamily serine protease
MKFENSKGIFSVIGLPVVVVFPDSHAERAGIQPGDIVMKINEIDINNVGDYVAAMTAMRNRNQLTTTLQVKRGDQLLMLEMMIAKPMVSGLN